jgi:hypothetical protein
MGVSEKDILNPFTFHFCFWRLKKERPWLNQYLYLFLPTIAKKWKPVFSADSTFKKEISLGQFFKKIYLWRKVDCFVLFWSYEIHGTRMLQIMFLVSFESSQQGGVHGLGSVMFGLLVQKFLNIEWFFHWKLNWIVAENFRGIGTCLWCCWKDFDKQDLMAFIW